MDASKFGKPTKALLLGFSLTVFCLAPVVVAKAQRILTEEEQMRQKKQWESITPDYQKRSRKRKLRSILRHPDPYPPRTPQERERTRKKKDNDAYHYKGEHTYANSDKKSMHPSADAMDARNKKNLRAKERYRKHRVWLNRIFWWRDRNRPKFLRKKPDKPQYDPDEKGMWIDDPNYEGPERDSESFEF